MKIADINKPFYRKKKLKHLGDMASGALTSLEETINNLNPSMLSRHGLVDSLQRLVVRINDLGKTQFSVESENMPETLDQGTGLLLYRICSELINNTLKHSGAGKASLRFAVVKKNLRVRYTDDGHGFEYDLEGISGLNVQNRDVVEFYFQELLYRFTFKSPHVSAYKWVKGIEFLIKKITGKTIITE